MRSGYIKDGSFFAIEDLNNPKSTTRISYHEVKDITPRFLITESGDTYEHGEYCVVHEVCRECGRKRQPKHMQKDLFYKGYCYKCFHRRALVDHKYVEGVWLNVEKDGIFCVSWSDGHYWLWLSGGHRRLSNLQELAGMESCHKVLAKILAWLCKESECKPVLYKPI